MRDNRHRDAAISSFRKAVALTPDVAEAHNNLGVALRKKGQLDEAIACFRRAISLNRNSPELYNNLGTAMQDAGRLDEAIASFRHAMTLNPGIAEIHNNLGIALAGQGDLDEAIARHRQAIALKPGLAKAHYNLGIALLTRGELQQGWEEYEWRWKCDGVPMLPRIFSKPLWDGRPLEGRTIALHAEQGFGDAIKFIRYAPLVAERGGKIVIVCFAELERLFRGLPGGWPVAAPGRPLPSFDLHGPLLSLPRIFAATLSNIPSAVPYLQVDAEQRIVWQHRLSVLSPALNVGLAWAGRPTQRNDRNRSMKLTTLAPLARVPGVRFFSLQKGQAAAETKSPPPDMEIVDWTEELKDFADTAALIANLDLVISVDTAVAHLAGAIGRPTWTLLSHVAGWHWLLDREDSPWYPTMRLFRQPSPGDWDKVAVRVADALTR